MKPKLTFLLIIISFCFYGQNDVYLLKDSNNLLSFDDVKEQNFNEINHDVLDGYTKSTYWFKIPMSSSNENYIFRLLYERYNDAEAFQNNTKIKKLTNQRFLSYKFSRESDVYIKIKPKLHSYIPFELDTEESSILKNNNQLLLNGFYYGFAFLIIVFNFYYYFLFKDSAFLYYSLFLATMTFGIFTMDGMLNYFNIIGTANNFIMVLNYSFLAFFSLKFINKYLSLDIYYPELKRISYLLGSLLIVFGILFLIFESYYYLLALGLLVFSLLLVYWIVSIILIKKNLYNKILVFAYVIILFSAIDYFILKFIGISIIHTNATTIKIGAFLEMITLSIAVLYRMNVLKNENSFMKNEIIKYSKKLDKINSLAKNDNVADRINHLSLREKEIFDLIVQGRSNKMISSSLNISINTVKFHVKNIYDKLQVSNRKEAIKFDLKT